MSGSAYAAMAFGYSLAYGSTQTIQPVDQSLVMSFSTVAWDTFTWDNFTWDGVTLGPALMELDGDAENISLALHSTSDYYEPFTWTGGVIHFSPRRELR